MISVEEAINRIVKSIRPVSDEMVMLALAAGRVLAEDVVSRLTQPPFDVSAMDGYAVRAEDGRAPATLELIGESAAGAPFEGRVGAGQTVRIFTGARVPDGADAIVIQEDADAKNKPRIAFQVAAVKGRHIRAKGGDFSVGDCSLRAGKRLTPRDIGLAASMNAPWVKVKRRPHVAILATGDELALPGAPVGASQIISSNALSLAAQIRHWGGVPIDLGIARDNRGALRAAAIAAQQADFIVSTGGVSVGDHDLVQQVLREEGLEVGFWRVAMRPGKPSLFGALGGVPLLGLPGNPVSSSVCALILLRPALEALSGVSEPQTLQMRRGALARDLPANGKRQDYMRATLQTPRDEPGDLPLVAPFESQDSAMQSLLVQADCLLVRRPGAPASKSGDTVDFIPFNDV